MPTYLCDLDDVRDALGLTASETAKDDQITALLPTATAALERYARRNFTTPAASTKRLAARNGFLALPDLQTGEDYTLTRVSDSALLVEDTDYELEPVEAPDGVYTFARLISGSSSLEARALYGCATTTSSRRVLIDVEATFGFAAVPELAKRAAAIAISAWVSKGAPWRPDGGDGQGAPQAPSAVWSIPWAAKEIIAPLRLKDLS